MRVNLACVNTPAGQVTVVRPFVPEPGAMKFNTDVLDLVDKKAVRVLRCLGSLGGVSLWEAEWMSSPLGVGHGGLTGWKWTAQVRECSLFPALAGS